MFTYVLIETRNFFGRKMEEGYGMEGRGKEGKKKREKCVPSWPR